MTLRLNGSTSGYVELDSPAVGGNNTLRLPTSNPTVSGTSMVADSSGNLSFSTALSASSLNGGPLAGARNRIINGDMRIDQRNSGAAVTIPATTLTYVMDRWAAYEDTDGVISVQRVAEAPTGFVNSAKVTVTTADTSLAATQSATFRQSIEGFNAADLYWGYPGAQTVTLSFWVRSSLTGLFAGAISNSDNTRSYPFTYTISVANTWEYKTVTISGDTTGTWGTNAAIGIAVLFNLGAGSTYTGTAGAWVGTNIVSVTGSVNLIGTLNATWQITGVQLEAGTVATPFERRSYGQELALCQRYYETGNFRIDGYGASTARLSTTYSYKASKRINPTVSLATIGYINGSGAGLDGASDVYGFIGYFNVTSTGAAALALSWSSSAEL